MNPVITISEGGGKWLFNSWTSCTTSKYCNIASMHSYYVGLPGDDNNDARADHDDGLPPSAESGASEMPSPLQALETFRQQLLAENLPHELSPVCRMDGEEELRLDTFGHYKDKRKNFRVEPRMRFDNEVGVGSGPVGEFHVMCIADEGLGSSGAVAKPIIFSKGEKNHRMTIHNQSLRFLVLGMKSLQRPILTSILSFTKLTTNRKQGCLPGAWSTRLFM